MQGARLLPYYHEATERGGYLATCADCRARISVTDRQNMGCAFEAPIGNAPTEWILARPDGRPIPDGWRPTTCPLYLCRLPGLDEVRAALPQWKHGTLADWLGEAPPAELLSVLAALDDGVEVYKADRHRPREG